MHCESCIPRYQRLHSCLKLAGINSLNMRIEKMRVQLGLRYSTYYIQPSRAIAKDHNPCQAHLKSEQEEQDPFPGFEPFCQSLC